MAGYAEFDSAIQWLNAVGEWDTKSPNDNEDFAEAVNATLNHLSARIAAGDPHVATLLADLERQANVADNPRPDLISDSGERLMRRRDHLYAMTGVVFVQAAAPDAIELLATP